jgi:ornithine carbamoyltransferase
VVAVDSSLKGRSFTRVADWSGDDLRRVLKGVRVVYPGTGNNARQALMLACTLTEDVFYGPGSAVWDEAESRLHARKALLALVVG